MTDKILEVRGLTKTYGGEKKPGAKQPTPTLDVLKGIDIDIYRGDVVCLIGPSGCGKSTFLRCLNRLEIPSSGSIKFEGTEVDEAHIDAVRQKMGMVFQHFNLFPHMTIMDNMTLAPIQVKHMDRGEAEKKALALLDRVGLQDRARAYPIQLSGGQKRRVAVAGVMAMKPRILVLDEPAAGLDPEGRDDILSEVKEYHKKTGTTVLLVSHSMEDIAKYANRVLVMSNKKIAMYDTVEKVFARAPELLELGLSVPQVTKIFLKLREMGVDVPADVYTIPYAVKMILEAKRRREAGESLVLPREAKKEGGAAGC